MSKKSVFFVFIALALILGGCETMGQKTQTGGIAGGLLCAATGGRIGHQSGHGGEGAAIGAAVGLLSGGLIGNQMDKADQEAKATNPNYITVMGIVDLAAKSVPDDVIISEIQRTRSVYHLSSEVITYLKQNKVGDKVVNYMLSTAN